MGYILTMETINEYSPNKWAIRNLRVGLGLTLAEFARALDISPQLANSLDKGACGVTQDMQAKIISIFNASPSIFFIRKKEGEITKRIF
jgi:transcriptional regulator with XRE-family HTH domain